VVLKVPEVLVVLKVPEVLVVLFHGAGTLELHLRPVLVPTPTPEAPAVTPPQVLHNVRHLHRQRHLLSPTTTTGISSGALDASRHLRLCTCLIRGFDARGYLWLAPQRVGL